MIEASAVFVLVVCLFIRAEALSVAAFYLVNELTRRTMLPARKKLKNFHWVNYGMSWL